VTTLVSKWGNSLAVRLPRSVAAEVHVEDGDAVDVTVHEGAIIIRPRPKRYSIDEVVEGITPKNRHGEVDWGKGVGKEVW
jgi:antitoxin MazE